MASFPKKSAAKLARYNCSKAGLRDQIRNSLPLIQDLTTSWRSSTPRVGVETIWTVKLEPGKYTYLCDRHAGMMRGSFRVTA